ncbi:hypothetical protein [Streptomyces sp. AK02-04a]|uniref:hypothetical protein n=1 Tax=Streptomyces sp. AK02-04a TaxID=3028649 RepID=UPI0029A0FE08|nr:hypothetical protein [Streptomyces sp. AK02-04a]MDX3764042.1 hypothetical protein [Streptomyces sp. AK02-04a]
MSTTSLSMRVTMARAAVPLLFAALLGSGMAGPAMTAQAGVLSANCTGTEHVAFDPGMTLTAKPTKVTVDGKLNPCQTSVPGVTAAAYQETLTATLGCLDPLVPGTGIRTFHWKVGHEATSTFAYTRTVSHLGAALIVTYTGTITNGLFSGHTATQIITQIPHDPLLCATDEGVTSSSGTVTLEIV